MPDDHEELTPFCPRYQHAVEIIGRRWTGAIVRAMLAGATRFSEFTETVPGLSDRLLSERLQQLEDEEIVERVVLPEKPVRVEYRLTHKGRGLAGVVLAVSDWAEHWIEPEPAGERRA